MPLKRDRNRTPNGAASLYADRGYLRINLTYKGQRERRALRLGDTPQNRAIVTAIVAQINRDIALGEFRGLDSYFDPGPEDTTIQGLFALWLDYLLQCNTPDSTIASRHRPLLANLRSWGKDITTTEQAAKFLGSLTSRQKPKTTNTYLSLLKAWGRWAIAQGHRPMNPFEPIRPYPGAQVAAEGEPFTQDEVSRILGAMGESSYYAHYVDFTYFLLATGVRIGEAIALRWREVDLDAGTVTIAETLTRPKGGKRTRKPPKTGSKGVRTLPLTDELKTVLRGRRPRYCHPNHLVFPGPKGRAIHDNNYRNRAWKNTLKAAGVPFRKPYFCRHTFASWAIAQGTTLPDAAKMLGHTNSRMVQQTYARSTGKITMPVVRLERLLRKLSEESLQPSNLAPGERVVRFPKAT